jgi:hypothetical protein
VSRSRTPSRPATLEYLIATAKDCTRALLASAERSDFALPTHRFEWAMRESAASGSGHAPERLPPVGCRPRESLRGRVVRGVLVTVLADSDLGTPEFEQELVEILTMEGDAPAKAPGQVPDQLDGGRVGPMHIIKRAYERVTPDQALEPGSHIGPAWWRSGSTAGSLLGRVPRRTGRLRRARRPRRRRAAGATPARVRRCRRSAHRHQPERHIALELSSVPTAVVFWCPCAWVEPTAHPQRAKRGIGLATASHRGKASHWVQAGA